MICTVFTADGVSPELAAQCSGVLPSVSGIPILEYCQVIDEKTEGEIYIKHIYL